MNRCTDFSMLRVVFPQVVEKGEKTRTRNSDKERALLRCIRRDTAEFDPVQAATGCLMPMIMDRRTIDRWTDE